MTLFGVIAGGFGGLAPLLIVVVQVPVPPTLKVKPMVVVVSGFVGRLPTVIVNVAIL
jgi:hypothetical protein